jgi:metal-sulfur cluster biosynthetic enzyme
MYMEETVDKLVDDAEKIGPSCKKAVTEILGKVPRPEMGFRSCLGLIRLAKVHSVERLEKACAMALKIKSCRYRDIRDILERKLEDSQLPKGIFRHDFSHRNIRGGRYYRKAGRAKTC